MEIGRMVGNTIPIIHSIFRGFSHRRYLRMSIRNGTGPYNYYVEFWSVPDWAIVAAALILPGVRLKQFLRRRKLDHRKANGLCALCGYDLRASPGRCPECGLVPARPAGAE